ncbi:hypothetical protein N7481_012574 [Penicillium waksmanii]|uniref:uncharacterized protein n=1 Tax=Penicillium waksmanii TaxID=69791 RepID=UPI00254825A4|nr:uncharacterized protein N7481_012574 [Penicillium waksmanii]KAJ5965860.1 hypothetical protein N7481_012574 [Penicillium waksmanii]
MDIMERANNWSPGNYMDDNELLQEIAGQTHSSLDDLEDVYPCTALQEGMMAITKKDPMAYTVEYEYRMSWEIDTLRLHNAWDCIYQANPILRTRIIPTRLQGCVQAVVRGRIPWEEQKPGSFDAVGCEWRAGAPLVKFTLLSDADNHQHTLTILIHHALCDDWSMALLLQQVDSAYHGKKIAFHPFRPLIDYISQSRREAEVFWAAEFEDAHQSSMKGFPARPAAGYEPQPTESRQYRLSSCTNEGQRFTINSKVRLAWAILQSHYTGSPDNVFGAIDAGRGTQVQGIESLSGPALNCLPVRVILNPGERIVDALHKVQSKWAATIPVQHIGLQNLSRLGQGPAAACQFQTLLAVEPRNTRSIPSLFVSGRELQKTYDTYSLILRCRPSAESMCIEASFDPAVITPSQTERLLQQFAHIYEQVESTPAMTLRDINTISLQDKFDLCRWNLPVPMAASRSVLHLIYDRVYHNPQDTAVCSWDGDLTYKALDGLSSALANRLFSLGIRPGHFVPLCLEKSKWTTVSMLAVIKAGAAFALLDPAYPVQRLQEMYRQLQASLIIISPVNEPIVSVLTGSRLIIDSTRMEPWMSDTNNVLSEAFIATPQDAIYATFTSGSTGTPKGVVVNHDGFASSALAHGELYGLTPQSRVLQFASPAFDSCIIEHLTTLIMGGCVCIPTTADCQSSLGDAVSRFAVNVACLTPTVTRIVSPESLHCLETLVFVGEAVLASDVARWEPYVNVRNAYGPAECSAVFSVQPHLQVHDPSNIGFPTGAIGWVVHSEDDQVLMPVGCIGELLIEGPTVGPGYSLNPQRTAAAFVDAPSWRRQFGSSGGKVYKTGDLVQHAGDGSFRYIGRKDTQAKLRGQRLEMADIEHHLRDSFSRSTDVVAEILRPQDILVAFICTDEPLSTACAKDGHDIFVPPSDQFRTECFAAQKELASALPAFMIPSLFLPVSRMPVTTSGKTNRRELQKCAALLSWEDLQSYRGSPSQSRRSSTSREEILQRIWAQSLNRSPEEMEVTESFFRLGGDSVSAMQVAAACKSAGFMVTVRDIFRYQSIEELAGKMGTSSNSSYLSAVADEDPIDTWFGLSPIQQLFVQHTPEGHDKFTQQFLLKVSKHQPESRIHQSIRDIVDRHSMLRALFRRLPNGQWEQAIRPKGTDSYYFRAHSLPSIGIQGLRDILSRSQRTLDIKQGTVLAIDLVTTPHQQFLSIMAHHMVIDLVSWRVILQDLDELLLTGTVSGLKSLSFQTWCLLQHEYSREALDPRKALPREIPPPPVELIHTALVYAFSQTFKDRPTPTILSEGHGREPWDHQIDVSRTVGWFTTLAPVFVNAKKDQGIADLLQRLKESRRSVPSNGWGYFTSRYLHEDGPRHFQNHGQMEIIFNYTGRFQQLEGSQALLKLATLPDHDLIPVPPDLPRFALIDVSATVMDGCLHISIWYNRRMKHQEKLHQWVLGFQKALESLPMNLRQHQRFTMSDFPLLSVTTDDQLQSLVSQISGKCRFSPSEIEEIYPCSPVQTGMWLSQIKNPDMYWSRMEWSLHPTCAPIDLNKVRDAWQRVVDRYTILRTTFATGPGDQNYPVQVVLQSIVADVKTIFSDGSIHANCDPLTQQHGRKQPSHWLILRPQPGGEVLCELNIHHMLIDGYTRRLLISDFQKGYDGQLKTDPGVQYRSYIAYCQEQDGKASQEYWNRYLEDVNPCIFPSLVSVVDQKSTLLSVPLNVDYGDRIQSVCNGLGITVFNLLQVAWGLVLRAYTGSDSVCFAYLTAGREIPLQGAQCIAGPLINLLVCRLSLSDEDGVESALRNNQSSYASSLDNQICTLVDVIHSLNLSGQALFNTAMSLQKNSINCDQNGSSGSRLEYRGGHDVTEFDLTVNLSVNEKSVISGDLTFWSHALSEVQAELIGDAFQHVIAQLLDPNIINLGQLDLVGAKNYRCMMNLKENIPEVGTSCIHDVIHERSLANPAASAICAWDGSFNYGELDCISSEIASHLQEQGIRPEIFVPVCSEKSLWVVAAALAVLKAGGAFILLDPSHPLERLQDMVRGEFQCPLVLTSSRQRPVARHLAHKVIVLDGEEQEVWKLHQSQGLHPMKVSPKTPAYATFTSGSTGKPKANIIEHQSFMSAQKAHHRMVNLAEGSRVLQFASHAFDASIVEILTTLIVGGCVCIPQDIDRQQRLAGFIQEYQVDWALLTPSVSRMLDPKDVTSLRTLVLGGEGMTKEDVRRWSSQLQLINAYGPSECSVIATVQSSLDALYTDPADIGMPAGGATWAVSPQNSAQLTAIGAVGELLIEGPIVGRGYANRPEQTTASFIDAPAWLQSFRSGRPGRLYLTGDLVRLLPNGSTRYIGRKDRQVKVNGQRIELAEVEHHVQQSFSGSPEVLAEVIAPKQCQTTYLVAAVNISNSHLSTKFDSAVTESRKILQSDIPSFLIPAAFFPLHSVPRMLSGKVDRPKLRQVMSHAMEKQLEGTNQATDHVSQDDLSPIEHQLRCLWSKVLRRPAETIGSDDHFFRLGGDSIAVMRLASSGGPVGLEMAVSNIFKHPRLRDLARVVACHSYCGSTSATDAVADDIAPFSLLQSQQRSEAQAQASLQCGILLDQIEDIYPCTPLQAALASVTEGRSGAYVAFHRYRLPPSIDLDRLHHALDRVLKTHAILRTRLIYTNDLGCLQVVVKSDAVDFPQYSCDNAMGFGKALAQFKVFPVPASGSDIEEYHLMLTMHHAVYDAWSLARLAEAIDEAYSDPACELLKPAPFKLFVKHVISQSEIASQRWNTEFHGISVVPFPSLPSPAYRPHALAHSHCEVPTGPFSEHSVTRTTATWLAWALVQSQYQSSEEAVFGIVSSGRRAPIRGIENMTGPTIATLPLRVTLDGNKTVTELLEDLQQWSVDITAVEQLGLHQIAKLNPEAAECCRFQTLLMVTGREADDGSLETGLMQHIETTSGLGAFSSYALQLTCILKADSVIVDASYDENVVPEWHLKTILDQFSHTLQQVYQKPRSMISDIPTLSPCAIDHLRRWAFPNCPPSPNTVRAMIEKHSASQPLAPAVCSWDGNFCYDEVLYLARKVGSLLVTNGIGSESFVPIYMERSRWTVIAMLGVLHAQAAFVLLDTAHPVNRIRDICNEFQPSLILSAGTNMSTAQSLAPTVISVGEDTLQYQMTTSDLPNIQNPYQALYAIFTSGSTGKPKGVVVENGAFVTMSTRYAEHLQMDTTSRILQFSSYAFDVSMFEMLGTLIIGGCICILSGSERKEGPTEAVVRMQPSHAIFTPSLLRVLAPADLPSVHTISLIGEPVIASDIRQWANQVRLLNSYGPAECTVFFTIQTGVDVSSPANIGFPIAGNAWLANPRDPHRPVPIGAVGEILLQGSLVGRGYLNNPDQTASAFLPCPRWLQDFSTGDHKRVYRTGDLARYEADGSLVFVGRRDYQVKLRGQRLELGDVEENIRHHCPGCWKNVVTEIITPAGPGQVACLVAFVVPNNPDNTEEPSSSSMDAPLQLDIAIPPNHAGHITDANTRLCAAIPDYMVPSAFIPLRQMPETVGGKLDRRRLRDAVATMTRQQIEHFAPNINLVKQPMSSDLERMLQDVWAETLSVTHAEIGAEDSFFRLGGDSISALKATSRAVANGIQHTVGELFRWETIRQTARQLATKADISSTMTKSPVNPPLSLIHPGEHTSIVSSFFAEKHPFSADNIVDILPTLPYQEFYIQHSSPVEYAYLFPVAVDFDRLCRACYQVVSCYSILRTVFVNLDDRIFQVILQSLEPSFEFVEQEDPEAYMTHLSRQRPTPTTQLLFSPVSFKVITSTVRREFVFLVSLSHAQYDQSCIGILWHAIAAAYAGQEVPEATDFANVVHHRIGQNHTDAFTFWKEYLHDASPAALSPFGVAKPSLPPVELKHPPTAMRGIDRPYLRSEATMSTLVKSALAWVIAHDHTSQSDLVFGQVVHGRGGLPPGIGNIFGPCINTLPVRITIDTSSTVAQFMRYVQTQQMAVFQHDSLTLPTIAKHSTSWPEDVRFGLRVHHESPQPNSSWELGGVASLANAGWGNAKTVPGQMDVVSIERDSGLDLIVTGAGDVLGQPFVDQLADSLTEMIQLFSKYPNAPLTSLRDADAMPQSYRQPTPVYN